MGSTLWQEVWAHGTRAASRIEAIPDPPHPQVLAINAPTSTEPLASTEVDSLRTVLTPQPDRGISGLSPVVKRFRVGTAGHGRDLLPAATRRRRRR